jgi:hypothetical protein
VVVHAVILAVGRLRQEDLEFKARPCYIMRPCLKREGEGEREKGREKERERERERERKEGKKEKKAGKYHTFHTFHKIKKSGILIFFSLNFFGFKH